MIRTVSNPDVRVHGKGAYEKYVSERKYEILDQIGKGGHGRILNARDTTTDKMLVCKAVPKKNARGKQEIMSLARLQGGNTIKLHDFYEDDDHYYMIMDKGWKDVHQTHIEPYDLVGADAEAEAKQIIAAVLKTLTQSHAKRVLHLDIKAGNLLWLDETKKKLVVIDWGLSMLLPKEQDHVEVDGFAGTPWFMAPELLRSEASHKSDVWATGVLCAQLLTKQFPFNDVRNSFAPSVAAIWRSILMDELNTDSSRWKGVSEDAKHFVRWLLNKNPSERPSALEALQHPWLCEHTRVNHPDAARGSRYEWSDPLHKQCLLEIARRLNTDVVVLSSSLGRDMRQALATRKTLRAYFDELDTDKDGIVRCSDILRHTEHTQAYKLDTIDTNTSFTFKEFESFVLQDPELPLYVFDT